MSRKIHVEDGWGTEEGKLYTPDMTGCLPLQEEVVNLSMKGYIDRGKIVCQRGIRDEHGSSTST